MAFLIFILILAIAIIFAILSSRLRELEQKLGRETEKRSAAENAIAELNRRLSAIERSATPVSPPPTPAPKPVEKPAPAAVSSQLRLCQFCGRALVEGAAYCACGARIAGVHPPATPPPLPAPQPAPVIAAVEAPTIPSEPRPTLRDRLRARIGDQEWEAIVGGSWLNKLGVLLLVIGIALLLGYEFTRVGPAARIAMGLAVSLAMLFGGALLERRPLYAIFGRGLLGGGWAALYFTTYAMHAVPAAKVIDNAFLATALLLIVACGMIVHSLRYRSQTVSGLAYFIAFATLALGESTLFSVLALIPLVASLLVLAYRFDWFRMAVFGVFATYATCASRPDVNSPLAGSQALFAVYWLLFEIFDVLRLRRRVRGFTIESLILPLNALGFLALSAVKWHRALPDQVYLFLAGAAALYLASALVRVWFGSWTDNASTLERIASGEYEGPVTISAALAAAGVFLKAPGVWIDAGWLIEGELLFLAGVRFGRLYLRQLAGAVFTSMLVRLLATDVPLGAPALVFAKHAWMSWTPVTVAAAAVFYFNRALRVLEGAVYSSSAAALIALVLAFECPRQFLAVAWLIFAALLFELGFRRRQAEFLWQSYAIGALGSGAGFLNNVFLDDPEWSRRWLPLAIAAAIHFAITMRIRSGAARVAQAVPWITSGSAAAFLVALAWKLAPGDYLGVAWLAIGAILFELAIRKTPGQLRIPSYFVLALGFARVFYFDVVLVRKDGPPAQAISLAAAALICAAMSARVFRRRDQESEWHRDLQCAAAALFAATFAWLELPPAFVALAWAAIGLAIFELGFAFSLPRFRVIANLAALAAFGRLFFANFTNPGDRFHFSDRMFTVLPVALSEYFIWWRYRAANVLTLEKTFSRLYLYTPAILICVLMRFELGRSMAAVGWALFSLALFRTGLAAGIADLRWQSYAIALLAFGRCWSVNFYMPQRVLTGAIVVSSFYAAQLLAPRDRYSRTFFSLLGSALLAVLLFYEVSGGMLTMAWGMEALALLAAGFPLRDRVQRLSGLFLFMVCVLKLFLYDLRELETINRILSFIVLGLILVSVSWIYTRFRDRIQRYF